MGEREQARQGAQDLSSLLAGLRTDRPNQVWPADITNLPMRKGFPYLVAIHKFGPPEIMNTDQGSQFTSFDRTCRFKSTKV